VSTYGDFLAVDSPVLPSVEKFLNSKRRRLTDFIPTRQATTQTHTQVLIMHLQQLINQSVMHSG